MLALAGSGIFNYLPNKIIIVNDKTKYYIGYVLLSLGIVFTITSTIALNLNDFQFLIMFVPGIVLLYVGGRIIKNTRTGQIAIKAQYQQQLKLDRSNPRVRTLYILGSLLLLPSIILYMFFFDFITHSLLFIIIFIVLIIFTFTFSTVILTLLSSPKLLMDKEHDTFIKRWIRRYIGLE